MNGAWGPGDYEQYCSDCDASSDDAPTCGDCGDMLDRDHWRDTLCAECAALSQAEALDAA